MYVVKYFKSNSIPERISELIYLKPTNYNINLPYDVQLMATQVVIVTDVLVTSSV